MENYDKTGQAFSPELAKVINSSFLIRPSEEKSKTLCDMYCSPENCPNIKVPRINEEIWPSLKKILHVQPSTSKFKDHKIVQRSFFNTLT